MLWEPIDYMIPSTTHHTLDEKHLLLTTGHCPESLRQVNAPPCWLDWQCSIPLASGKIMVILSFKHHRERHGPLSGRTNTLLNWDSALIGFSGCDFHCSSPQLLIFSLMPERAACPLRGGLSHQIAMQFSRDSSLMQGRIPTRCFLFFPIPHSQCSTLATGGTCCRSLLKVVYSPLPWETSHPHHPKLLLAVF